MLNKNQDFRCPKEGLNSSFYKVVLTKGNIPDSTKPQYMQGCVQFKITMSNAQGHSLKLLCLMHRVTFLSLYL
jgi:hypothetical protein